MRILALDTSTHCGFAFDDGDRIECGTKEFTGIEDYAVMGRLFRDWLKQKIEVLKPDVFVIEQCFFHRLHPTSAFLLNGLFWEANRTAELFDLPRFAYAPMVMKKMVTGSAKAKKSDVIAAVVKCGYNPKNDHEADAIGLILTHKMKLKII